MVKMSQFRPIIKPQLSNNKWNPVGNSVIALQAAKLKDVQVSLEHQNNLQGKKLVEHELNYITIEDTIMLYFYLL